MRGITRIFVILILAVSTGHGESEVFVVDYAYHSEADDMLKKFFGDRFDSEVHPFRVIGSKHGVYMASVKNDSTISLLYRAYGSSPSEVVPSTTIDSLGQVSILDFRVCLDVPRQMEYSIALLLIGPRKRLKGFIHRIENHQIHLTSKFDLNLNVGRIASLAEPVTEIGSKSGHEYDLVRVGLSLDPFPSLVTVNYLLNKRGDLVFQGAFQRAVDIRRGIFGKKKNITESARFFFGTD